MGDPIISALLGIGVGVIAAVIIGAILFIKFIDMFWNKF